jgi:hypothetical protein
LSVATIPFLNATFLRMLDRFELSRNGGPRMDVVVRAELSTLLPVRSKSCETLLRHAALLFRQQLSPAVDALVQSLPVPETNIFRQ